MFNLNPANQIKSAPDTGDLGANNPLDDSIQRAPSTNTTSFADQSYSSRYGSRFGNIDLCISFTIEENVLSPKNGGDRELFLKDRQDQMQLIETDLRGAITANNIEKQTHSMQFLSGLGMLTLRCSPSTADLLHRILEGKKYLNNFGDVTGSFFHTPEDKPIFHTLWESANFTSFFLSDNNAIGRFDLEFSDGETVPDVSLDDLEEVLQENDLIGKVGVDLAGTAQGKVRLTCSMSELQLFTEITGLTKIDDTKPEIIPNGYLS